MKATLHCGKRGSADHNDRNFDYENCGDGHIDPSRVKDNYYQSYKDIFPFKKAEEQFYKDQYSDWIKEQNKSNRRTRNQNRKKTVKSLLKSPYTKPSEMILQIGNRKEHPDPQVFADCVHDFVKSMAPYAENYHILNVAIHNDEATPHAHIRGIWDYVDESGNRHISQNKGLEALGIPLPEKEAPVSVHNNRKITFDATIREKWYDICEEHGIEIDRQPNYENQVHMEKAQLIIHDLKKEIDELEKENEMLREQIEMLEKELEETKKEKSKNEMTR